MILFYPSKLMGYARIKLICDTGNISYTYKQSDPFKVIVNTDYAVMRKPIPNELGAKYPVINGACENVTKWYVDEVFAKVFGYSSLIDPTDCHYYLRKGNGQGDKSGKIFTEPQQPKAGYVYQQVINNILGGYRIDYRVHIIGNEIVWIREKWKVNIVSPDLVRSRPANDVFMDSERNKILEFCCKIGLNFGELDVLKDYATGKIYIIDVNDMPGVRSREPLQPGYKEELEILVTKFKQYYDHCLKVKDTRGHHIGCIC